MRAGAHGHPSFQSAEQVPVRPPAEQRAPPPPLVLGPVVIDVASLAKRDEVGVGVVRGVVVSMRGGEDHLRSPQALKLVQAGQNGHGASLPVSPCSAGRIPPAPVPEAVDEPAMRSAAPLTGPAGPAEPDHGRKLRPVDGVEEAVLAPDRHGGMIR